MPENLLDASATAVLGFISVALVLGVLALLKRKNGNGKHETDEVRDRVVKSIAYIEEHPTIEMPANWRRFVDERIEHKRRSERMLVGVLAHLSRRGEHAEIAELLEKLERMEP